MSEETAQKKPTTRYFLLEVTSSAELGLETPSFSQFGIQPVDAMVSLNFVVSDNKSHEGINMVVKEFTGEDIGEFLSDFISPSEMALVGVRQFAATQKSYNSDGMPLDVSVDDETLLNVEDDFDFLDEGDDGGGDDGDTGNYALPR